MIPVRVRGEQAAGRAEPRLLEQRGQQLEASQKKPEAEVSNLREAAKLIGVS